MVVLKKWKNIRSFNMIKNCHYTLFVCFCISTPILFSNIVPVESFLDNEPEEFIENKGCPCQNHQNNHKPPHHNNSKIDLQYKADEYSEGEKGCPCQHHYVHHNTPHHSTNHSSSKIDSQYQSDEYADEYDIMVEQADTKGTLKNVTLKTPSQIAVVLRQIGVFLFVKPYIYMVTQYRAAKKIIASYFIKSVEKPKPSTEATSEVSQTLISEK